jgi:hypothetical protein
MRNGLDVLWRFHFRSGPPCPSPGPSCPLLCLGVQGTQWYMKKCPDVPLGHMAHPNSQHPMSKIIMMEESATVVEYSATAGCG